MPQRSFRFIEKIAPLLLVLSSLALGCVQRTTTQSQPLPLIPTNSIAPATLPNEPPFKLIAERSQAVRLPPLDSEAAVYHPANKSAQSNMQIGFLQYGGKPPAPNCPAPEVAPAPEVDRLPPPVEEPGPPQPERVFVPLNNAALPADAKIESNGELVSLSVREAPLDAVLTLLAQQQGLSMVASSNLRVPITVTLQPMPIDQALDAVLNVAGCTWSRRGNVIYVSAVSRKRSPNPFIQGRMLKVFTLNYLSAIDVEKVVTGLLSPVGRVFIRSVDMKDRRRTQEQLVVEDLPDYLNRIAMYIARGRSTPAAGID